MCRDRRGEEAAATVADDACDHPRRTRERLSRATTVGDPHRPHRPTLGSCWRVRREVVARTARTRARYHGRGPTPGGSDVSHPTRTEELHGEFPQAGRSSAAIVAVVIGAVLIVGVVAMVVLGFDPLRVSQGVISSFFPPQAVTDRGEHIRQLYDLVFGIAVVIFFVVEGLIVWSVIPLLGARPVTTSCPRRPTAMPWPRWSGRSSRR
jgi:hypothetical protein